MRFTLRELLVWTFIAALLAAGVASVVRQSQSGALGISQEGRQ